MSTLAAAGLGALLFAVHPLQVESVAWISEVRGLLCGLFALLTLWQYVEYADARRSSVVRAMLYAGATAALLLALLSKPAAVAVPLMAAVLGVGLLRRRPAHGAPGNIALVRLRGGRKRDHEAAAARCGDGIRAVAGGAAAGCLGCDQFLCGQALRAAAIERRLRPNTAVRARRGRLFRSAGFFCRPWLSCWSWSSIDACRWLVSRCSSPGSCPCWGWFPSISNASPPWRTVMFIWRCSDRRWSWRGSSSGGGVVPWRRRRRGACRPSCRIEFPATRHVARHAHAVRTCLAGQSPQRRGPNIIWATRLFSTGTTTRPLSGIGNRWSSAPISSRRTSAWPMRFTRRARSRKPCRCSARPWLTAPTPSWCKQNLEASSRNKKACEAAEEVELGVAEEAAGRIEEARRHYLAAIRIEPRQLPGPITIWATLPYAEGNWSQAIEHYETALKFQPEYAQARANLGAALLQLGRLQDAITQERAALIIDPALFRPAHDAGRGPAAKRLERRSRGRVPQGLGPGSARLAPGGRHSKLVAQGGRPMIPRCLFTNRLRRNLHRHQSLRRRRNRHRRRNLHRHQSLRRRRSQ